MNKTRLAEKRDRDKLKKDKKEIRLTNKNMQNKRNKIEKKNIMLSRFINYKKQKRQQNYRRKRNMN